MRTTLRENGNVATVPKDSPNIPEDFGDESEQFVKYPQTAATSVQRQGPDSIRTATASTGGQGWTGKPHSRFKDFSNSG